MVRSKPEMNTLREAAARLIHIATTLLTVWMLWASSPPHVGAEARGLPSQADSIAGEIFGVPVSMGNYSFAKRVAYTFPRPWGAADLPLAEREQVVWDNLILHFEGFRQGITVTEDELDAAVNDLLKDQRQSFSRRRDPDAYRRWVSETLREDVELLESQIRYVLQIRKLKDHVLKQQRVAVTEEEMRQAFLSDQHHVGGELVVFTTKDEAEAFYRDVKDPKRWEAMKTRGTHSVRPMSPMTLSAIIDLWGAPRGQIQTLHAMSLGSVGPPIPFGKQWGVLRLLEKRTGDLRDFPKERDRYVKRVEWKKKYQALEEWIDGLKRSARPTILVRPP
jgi:hypothetical protein